MTSPGRCQEKAEVEQHGGQIGHMVLQDPPTRGGCYPGKVKQRSATGGCMMPVFRECQSFGFIALRKKG